MAVLRLCVDAGTIGTYIVYISLISLARPKVPPLQRHEIIRLTEEHVRQSMQSDSSGHDWWHVWRVRNLAMLLCAREGADAFVTELAALLHDVADHKLHGGDDSVAPRVVRAWLEELGVEDEIVGRVVAIVVGVSFKGAGVEVERLSLEGQVVQDADRLDAIGAIGIARAFAHGGHSGRAIFDPEVSPEVHASFEAYKKSTGPSLNHFHEKLLLLKDRLNTDAARRIAVERHEFMQGFVDQFHAEWSCERCASALSDE